MQYYFPNRTVVIVKLVYTSLKKNYFIYFQKLNKFNLILKYFYVGRIGTILSFYFDLRASTI